MLTEFALRNVKPRTVLYKIADRDGVYATVSPVGPISFGYDYRLNGRRETPFQSALSTGITLSHRYRHSGLITLSV
jgi:hypothetical protein